MRILGFPHRFSVLRSVLLVGQKSLAPKSFFARPWRARPSPAHTPRHRRAPKRSTIPYGRLTRTVLCHGASVLRPPLLHSAPKSGAKPGAKVWILKVWSKVWSFFYEIFRTPLPGASLLSKSHKELLLRWMSYSNLKPYLTPLQNLNGEYRDTMIN